MKPLDDVVLEAKLRRLPKAEMHFHFEGAFRWSTIRELHHAGATFPATPPWLDVPRPFPDFTDFRQAFRDFVLPASGTPDAVERHAFEVIEDLARQNVCYAEIIVSERFHTMLGLDEAEVWAAIVRGRERARALYGIDVRLILGISRHRTPLEALATLDAVAEFALAPGWLSGIDLQGDERLGDNRAFAETFRRAARLGVKLRAHAGEICGAPNVRDAVRHCGVAQISHGVRAVEDPSLVHELATEGTVLHVCPTSNLLLECAPSYREHQLRALLDGGVRCTVNSDDPLLFGSDIENEYRVLVGEMGFTSRDVAELAKNAFRASLLDPKQIESFCADVDAVLRAGG